MRISLKFEFDKPLTLPSSYQRNIQGFIYHLIDNESFSNFLHNEGFGESRTFKLFTFSLLKGKYEFNKLNHTVTFFNYFYLEISSIVNDFIYEITKSLLSRKTLQLNHQKIKLSRYKIINKQIDSEKIKIEMISPICVYSTNKNNSIKTHYYSPQEEDFYQLINDNFKRKFSSVYKTNLNLNINIKPLEVKIKDKLIIKYQNIVIIAYKGKYELEGKKQFLDFLFNTGLGSKNSMGFGMFRVL
ncbi:MAG: CRISPR-associated endoribonuclease Cas6 [bacterium]